MRRVSQVINLSKLSTRLSKISSFPYPDQGAEYTQYTSQLYHFRLKKVWDPLSPSFVTIGYIPSWVVAKMPWTSKFHIDHDVKTVSIPYLPGKDAETTAISEQLEVARAADSFLILRKWRDEHYRLLGISRDVRMARAGVALFGVHTVGVHILGYCRTPSGEMKLWIPRRAATKHTYPGMLDNTVGGAMTADEDQFSCMLREAAEEASIPESTARALAKPVGAISYFYVRDVRAGDEVGLLQPATHYLYDMELPEDMEPQPADGEVEEFYLWSVGQTTAALKEGRFKPNSAVAWIDFLVRHGFVNAGNEMDYLELVARIHRRICF